jgi:esterase/lipase superfamily enzyme
MTRVYFATNRQRDTSRPSGFGADIVPMNASAVIYAIADVQGTDIVDEASGNIVSITEQATGGYSDNAVNEIIGAGKNLLVFIHGFANSFEDSIKRAAFNADWMRASGVAAADVTVLAFSWPSSGDLLAAPPHLAPDAYRGDQVQAGKSAYHLGYFLNNVDQLRLDFVNKHPDGRMFLLAHSMGNYALQGAVQWWFDNRGSDDLMFDETILAAADEVDDTFERKNGGRLSKLPKLAKRITVYYSRKDVAMYVSTTLNLNARLGFDGPDDMRNQTVYPTSKFRIVDCTEVRDFNLIDPPDATHQYYRRSNIVRADIAVVMGGAGEGGLSNL